MAEFKHLQLGDAVVQGQQAAMGRFKLGEAQRGVQAREGLTSALQAGTPEAMTQYSQQFPQEAQEFQGKQAESRKKQLEEGLFHMGVIEKLMSGVQDEQSFQQAKNLMGSAGMDVSKLPPSFDPNFIEQQKAQALGFKGKMEFELKSMEKGFKEREVAVAERNAASNEVKANALRTKAASSGQGKAPTGYRWAANGVDLEAIGGGPALKPTESQQKQLTGVTNLQDAIKEYTTQLSTWDSMDVVSPDARARMGTKYNNMMLQAKEAYNLGVLNGPDFEILQRVVTDPRTFTGMITSNAAMADQANELGRIMESIGKVAASDKTRVPAGVTKNEAPKAGRSIVRTGMLNGKKVVQYSDGTTEYAP